MKLTVLMLLLSANLFAAAPVTTADTTTTTDGKVHFEIFTSDDVTTPIGQALQLLALETARPELFTVTPRYFASTKNKLAQNTFWKTAYVAKYHRPTLAAWLQCVYFDPETHTCGQVLKIDFKNLKSKESELRKEFAANLALAKDTKFIKDTIFINGSRYEGPLAYGQLLNVVNGLLPKEKQLVNLGKYEVTKLYAVGNDKGLGARDFGLEREFVRWVPNLQIEVVAPESKLATTLLKATNAPGIPAYVFDKKSTQNVAVKKLAVAGRIQVKPSNYALFDMKSGVTEMRAGSTEIPNQLDLWVMSQCPYGVKAETAIINARAQNAIPETVKVNLRYIANEGKDGKWQALHGDVELQENIRQLAIQKTWPDKFWKYLEVRNQNYQSEEWKTAATAVGLNPAEVEGKMELGRKLMAQDIKDGATLKVSGSPTYLWQNKYVLNSDGDMKSAMGFNPQDYRESKTAGPKPASEKKQAVAPDAKCGS